MPRRQTGASLSYRSIASYLSSTRDVLHSERVRWGVTDEDIQAAGREMARRNDPRLNALAREAWMEHGGDKAAVAAAVMDYVGISRNHRPDVLVLM